jgi:hypothetical protein
MMEYFRVYYRHLKGYYVFVPFDTMPQALEYIHNNALVWPLPGLYVMHAVYDGARCTETEIDWRAWERENA